MQTPTTYSQATELLFTSKPTSYFAAIQETAKEHGLEITADATNMLDGLLCHFSFVIISLGKTMRPVPSLKDFLYCINIMGFSDLLSDVAIHQSYTTPVYGNITDFFTALNRQFVLYLFSYLKQQECMIMEEVQAPALLTETDLHTALIHFFPHTYLFENSEFRKTNSAYIGPWKFHNGGRGNCLFYSLRQLITVWKAWRKIDAGSYPGDFYYSLWPQRPSGTNAQEQRAYLKAEAKMEEDSVNLRKSTANYFLEDLNSLMPGNLALSYTAEGKIIERPMTKGDFIYMAKEGDLKLEPDFTQQRNEWAKSWCTKAKADGEWGCMRMITGFAHIIKDPRSIALYFFRVNEKERSRSLDRTDEECIQPPGASKVVAKDMDAILQMPVKRMEDEIKVGHSGPSLKTLGTTVPEYTLDLWTAERAEVQRHCALYHEGGAHWCVLVSALQYEELRRYTNIDSVARPLFT
jgi:hypothetical protein